MATVKMKALLVKSNGSKYSTRKSTVCRKLPSKTRQGSGHTVTRLMDKLNLPKELSLAKTGP